MVYVVGKQWMWKFQHPEGQREINELHVPRRPAVQAAADLRGRDPQLFRARFPHPHGRAARPLHHGLVPANRGRDVSPVLLAILRHQPRRHDRPRRGHGAERISEVAGRCRRRVRWRCKGRKTFLRYRCISCHSADSNARAPVLEELYGKTVHLRDGRTVIADEDYLRESIVRPGAKIVMGWENIMPTFQGQVSQEEINELVAFIKSLKKGQTPRRVDESCRRRPGNPPRARTSTPAKENEKAMSTTIQEPVTAPPPPEVRETYLNVAHGVASWLLTKDHKRIAILYLVTVTVMFFLGGVAISIVRLNLMTPEGGLVSADTYNRLFTMHGVIMVFFFLVPVVPTVLGNFCLPLMIGAKDLAFPRINLASWYLFVIGAGWTLFAMLGNGAGHRLDVLHALHLAIVALQRRARPGRHRHRRVLVDLHRAEFHRHDPSPARPRHVLVAAADFRLDHLCHQLYFLLAVPGSGNGADPRHLRTALQIGIFDPALGGDPLLFQHLFWFYSHPAVYIMILPGMGIVSEVIPCFARKNLFGYTLVACRSFGIACLGFFVWAHHMFVAGISMYAAMVFSVLSYLVAVPSAIKVFNWTATLYKGSISFEAPMLYALGFVCLFTAGGLTGLFLAALGMDMHVHDTYFVIAHFHFIMVGGMVMGYMGGLHYWWPKITGRLYSEWWSRLAALIIFVGFFLTFLPQFIVGYAGMPRRYHRYPPEFQVWNVMSSAGASILAVGYILPLLYLPIRSSAAGGAESRGSATGLEWQTRRRRPGTISRRRRRWSGALTSTTWRKPK